MLNQPNGFPISTTYVNDIPVTDPEISKQVGAVVVREVGGLP
jgi:hypothetical protein